MHKIEWEDLFEMSQNNISNEQREHAWNYFQLHASQRMSVFNFFVVMSALFTTALATSFTEKFNYPAIGVILGVGLVVIAFIFWKLDQRIRFLIKLAEKALRTIESHWINEKESLANPLALFSIEKIETGKKCVESRCWKPHTYHLKYSMCFGVAYVLIAVVGIIGTIASYIRLN